MGSEAGIIEYARMLLEEGKKREAQLLLAAYLKRHPTHAEAWWVMSQAVESEQQERDCLERVLRLNPEHLQARRRLEALNARSASTTKLPFSAPAVQPFVVPLDEDTLEQASQRAEELLAEQGLSTAEPTPPSWAAFWKGEEQAQQSEQPPERGSPSYPSWEESSSGKEPVASLPGRAPVQAPPPRRRSGFLVWALLGSIFCLFLIGGALFFTQEMWKATTVNWAETQTVAAYLTNLPRPTLPPTWTPTPLPSRTPSLTPLPPTETAPPTPTSLYTPTKTPIPTTAIGLVVGKHPPDFALREVSTGAFVRLWDYLGERPILLFFWATWCPYCQNEMDDLKELYASYEADGLMILAVEIGQPIEEVLAFKNQYDLTFPVLSDSTQEVASQYKISAIPHHFFISRSGKIVTVVRGAMTITQLERQTAGILRVFPTATATP
ncbi:MAG: redoxin domain-containing protein [Anaerolineales bacterium]|nr:redoxin domain-containing protein [Anaerolineales bacterium]